MRKLKYEFFTPAQLKPTGWLRKQLQIQADGLSGNLDKVWPDVRDSAWIGGDREGWERVPYWLDGFIPLAYLLEDEDRIARAKRYMDAIMDAQAPDGWLCPCKPEERGNYDTWAALLMCKVLSVYADCSGEERAVDCLRRALLQLNDFLNSTTLRNWGSARWFEGVIPALWLYDRTGEEWLIELCWKLKAQGIDWDKVVHSPLWETRTTGWDFLTHVVNVAMMLKSEALMSRLDGSDPDRFAMEAMEKLLREHGMACHHFSGDECLAGQSPIHGSELCSVVEAMYSYEQLFSISGNLYWLDRLEETAFNALPATVSPDMWTHQYAQLTNQVAAVPMDASMFRADGPESAVFGLEPNFGCCTANFNQGFPKLALSTFMKYEEDGHPGLASCVLAPARVTTAIRGAKVEAELVTGYPFRDTLTYRVTTDRPVRFGLRIRIPSFASSATVNGQPVPVGQMYEVVRLWDGTVTVTVRLRFETVYETRPDQLFTVWRGPLLYALPIGETWTPVEYVRDGVERKFPHCDYRVEPTTPWNFGFAGDTSDFRYGEGDFDAPFTPDRPPVWLDAPMAPVAWRMEEGHCARLPDSPAATGPVRTMRLIPYGCTNLRLTETCRVVGNGSSCTDSRTE
ncbi:MAG: beta-L-arabinofuranosidase domain-containing protein [Eubacteriales bacterium]